MNVKFIVKGLLLALPLGCLLAAGWIFWQTPLGRPLDPTPPPPTILVPRGPMPAGPVGLEEWARYRGGDYQRTGSGFLLTLADGEVVAVTTAHSVALGDAAHPLERIALRVAGQSGFVGEFDTLRGPPGQHFTLENLTLDYLLLQPGAPLAPGLALAPDPRGGPLPGERVTLFSGLGDGSGGPRALAGTVQSANEAAIWVLMDEHFDPSLMSGSPCVSQHTGQVVGMALAASYRRNRLLLGAHPIGSLVDLAETAKQFIPTTEWPP